MNDLDFHITDKDLSYQSLVLEIRRFNILLEMAREDDIRIPSTTFADIQEKINKFVTQRGQRLVDSKTRY